MDNEILTINYLSDELLTAFGHRDHPQCVMNSAEIMTVAIVAVMYYGGNFALARRCLHAPQWIGCRTCWAKADLVAGCIVSKGIS